MKHENTRKQTYSGSKKIGTAIIAALTAAALIATGWIANTLFKHRNKSNDKKIQNTKPVVQEETELNLAADFDINDQKAVAERAKAIYELSNKEYDELAIRNVIYIFNGLNSKVAYPDNVKTDKEKFEYLQSLTQLPHGVFNDFVDDNNKMGPRSYMFMSKSGEAKEIGKKLAEIIAKQKKVLSKSMVDGKVVENTDLELNAKEFYALYNQVQELVKENKLADGEVVLLLRDFNANNQLFTIFLLDAEADELHKAEGLSNPYQDKLFQDTAKSLNIFEIMEEAMQKDDKCGRELGEEYKAENKEEAKKVINNIAPTKEATSEIVDQGGKHVETQTKPISGNNGSNKTSSEPTTVVETSEFVVELPDAGTSTNTEKGGDVISEETYTYNQEEPTTIYSDADEEIEVIGGYHK